MKRRSYNCLSPGETIKKHTGVTKFLKFLNCASVIVEDDLKFTGFCVHRFRRRRHIRRDSNAPGVAELERAGELSGTCCSAYLRRQKVVFQKLSPAEDGMVGSGHQRLVVSFSRARIESQDSSFMKHCYQIHHHCRQIGLLTTKQLPLILRGPSRLRFYPSCNPSSSPPAG